VEWSGVTLTAAWALSGWVVEWLSGWKMRRKDNINYLRLLEWEFVRNQRSSLDCVPLRQTDIQFKISDNVLNRTMCPSAAATPTSLTPLPSFLSIFLKLRAHF